MIRLTSIVLLVCLIAGPGIAATKADLADAAMRGDRATVRTLLQQKADVNAAQIDGATALHWAVYNDDLETAQTLIQAGAKPDAANREGITPLYLSLVYGNPAMIAPPLTARRDANQQRPH